MLTPKFYLRDFNLNPFQAPWLKVKSASWLAVGGPDTARLEGWSMDRMNLSQALGLLRCEVELVESHDLPAWWGYVSGVELRIGRLGIKADLELISNRVKVSYTALPVETNQWASQRVETGWGEVLESQAIYGVKEKIITLQASTAGQALGTRGLELAAGSWPEARPLVNPGGAAGWDVALALRGWWSTLGWRYYSQPEGLIENLYEGAGGQDVGSGAGSQNVYQSFSVGAGGFTAEQAWLKVNVIGAPGDNLVVDLCADNAGAPGASLGSAALPGGAFAHSFGWNCFDFGPVALGAGVYWLWARRSGAVNGVNYYRLKVDEFCSYGGGAAWVGAGARVPAADLVFRVCGGIETTAQIADMASPGAGGQLLKGVKLETASGVFTNQYRVGNTTALAEISAHLRAGNSAGVRLLGQITSDRRLRVFLQPEASTAGLRVGRDGIILDQGGGRLPAWKPAAGLWAQVAGAWGEMGSQYQQVKDRVLLERVEYDPVSGGLSVGAIG